jgi:hypothetical protein
LHSNPLLGTLGNYGGFTQTIPLGAGSPAIDGTSSNCPATDQRGVSRSSPACDIGAYESSTLTTTASPTTGTVGTAATTGDSATLSSVYNPTGSVTFTLYSDAACTTTVTGMSGSGTISGVSASWSSSWTPTASGTYYWKASYPGDANNNAYTTACGAANEQIVVGKGAQTLSFSSTAPINAAVGGAGYTPTATSTSGLGVTITIDAAAASVCSVSSGAVSFLTVGTCIINANQAGNSNYNAASQVQQSFTVASPVNINSSLQMTKVITSYDRTPQASAPSGVYTITATFKNISTNNLTDLYFKVVTLTNGNLLLNADGGPAGVGAILTAPGHVVHPGDTFQVIYHVGLRTSVNFTLLVDAYGIGSATTSLAENVPSAGNDFRFETHDLGYSLFLPVVIQ